MRTCAFNGCERRHSAKGYCKVHYNMWRIGGITHAIGEKKRGRKPESYNKCGFEGCTNTYRAKGWCSTHYNQFYYKGKLSSTLYTNRRYLKNEKCSVIDCDKLAKVRGYCVKHYDRWRNTGTTDLIPRTYVDKKCRYEGCETKKHNHGYCAKHYKRAVLQIPYKNNSDRIRPLKKSNILCDVDGCDRVAKTKGWCDKHYCRYKRHGDPLTCYKRPRESDYVSINNIMKDRGTYSKYDDAQILRETFGDLFVNQYDGQY